MLDGTGEVKRRKKRRRSRGAPGARDYLEYVALRAALLLLRAVPLEGGAAAMGLLWRIGGPFTARHRRAEQNLRLAMPHLDDAGRRRILKQQWDNLGRTAAESLQIDRLLAAPTRVELSISRELDARLREPGGQVHVSMHSANWEVAGFPIRHYRATAGMYQKLTNPLVERFVIIQRSGVFAGGLYPKGRASARPTMQWVREGNAIALLGDHREARGVEMRSFGLPALANPFAAMVARRLGVPLIVGRAIRLPGSRFRVDAVEIPVPVTKSVRADVLAATQAIQDQFDSWIRERPGEWMWIQDRWRETRRAVSRGATGVAAACQRREERPSSGT